MTEHDLLEVVEIEESSGISAWGWDAYHRELQSPHDSIMLVARVHLPAPASQIAGFIVAQVLSNEFHVNNVAVRAEFRGQGIGRELLQTVMNGARKLGASLGLLEVRAGNEAAQRLYERCGFIVNGRRRSYYSRPVEDALLMMVSLES
jgi:ribosomal-protein-alanine N-acetyltransferase